MKRFLLAGSALSVLGLGNVAPTGPALAADGIKLSLSGYLNTAVLVNFEGHNDGSNGHLGDNRYNDGVFEDARIKFMGETTLDNGITVGALMTLYAEQKSGNQWRNAYGYFRGGFGEMRIGAADGALQTLCVTPVGGTANFGAFSQYQVINNAFSGFSAGVCNGVASFRGTHGEQAQKIVYLSPNFSGFQLGLSWTPNGNKKGADDGVGDFHSGMPPVEDGEQRDIFDAALNYTHDFGSWNIAWDGALSVALSQGGNNNPKDNKAQFYQTGLNLTFGQWSVGGGFQYYKNYIVSPNQDGVAENGQDGWVGGGGLAYNVDAWTVGLQYSYSDFNGLTEADKDRRINTLALTGKYVMGPGINLDSTLQYVWADGDKGDQAHGGYDSFGIGIGTNFTF